VTPRTSAGFLKFRPVGPGSRVAIVAPASPFKHADSARAELEAGLAEIRRLGLDPVFDERVFERDGFVAGTPSARAAELRRWWSRIDVDAIVAIRGGYGSVQVLSSLDLDEIRRTRTAFVGYSDLTSMHAWLSSHAIASVHGPMIDGRLAHGISAYDEVSFLTSLGSTSLGDLAPQGLEVLHPGEARGPLCGGTLTQLLASFGTPFEFQPPAGHVLFVDEVSERPYRLHRMLTQWRLAGRFAQASAVVFGQLPRCDEPGGAVTARAVAAECLRDFPGPVLWGFPSGHTTTPFVSLPFGVRARVVAAGTPRLALEEAAAEA
jgi:muramoyltetrapeptide carboxypeptidase